ncbi:MAG TPA: CotH kinase family protein [Anaeromyxobacter sp.]|nr:CotH kinase family protein [Anaeromyxobacter sp.]
MNPRALVAACLAAVLAACNGATPPLPKVDPPPQDPPPGCVDCVPVDPVDPGNPDPGTPTDRPPAVVTWPDLQQQVEPLAITFSSEWDPIVYDLWSKVYVPGRLHLGGTWYDVELRQRGDGAREHPKHSWKTRHPSGETHPGAPGTGAWTTRTRNFLAEYLDGGYLSDPFGYGLMLGAGVRSPRWRFVTLDVNGVHEGVYVEVQEADDKHFLRDHGFHEDSTTYRCGLRDCEMKLSPPASYQGQWEKETNESAPWDDLWTFLTELNRTPEHEFPAWLERRFDVDRLVRMYAVAILISWSGIDDSGSYLVHDAATGKWSFVPWDLNNARMVFWRGSDPDWSPNWHDAIPTYTLYDPATLAVAAGKSERYGVTAHPPFVVLFQRLWDAPALRNRVLDEVEEMLDGVFSPAQAFPRAEALHALIAEPLLRDPWVRLDLADVSVRYLKEYVTRRTTFLRGEIPKERLRGEGGLVVNAIGPGFIELYNREDAPRDLGGLTLTSDLRDRLQTALPAGTFVPAHGKITLPFTPGADGGEVGIFDAATQMPLDATFHAPLGARTYARIPDGAETWGWR